MTTVAIGSPERRAFRFGVTLDGSEGHRHRVIETARRAGAAGAHVLLATHHLGGWGALSPHYLVGDSEEMVENLLARRERWGISYITLPASALPIFEPVMARLAST